MPFLPRGFSNAQTSTNTHALLLTQQRERVRAKPWLRLREAPQRKTGTFQVLTYPPSTPDSRSPLSQRLLESRIREPDKDLHEGLPPRISNSPSQCPPTCAECAGPEIVPQPATPISFDRPIVLTTSPPVESSQFQNSG